MFTLLLGLLFLGLVGGAVCPTGKITISVNIRKAMTNDVAVIVRGPGGSKDRAVVELGGKTMDVVLKRGCQFAPFRLIILHVYMDQKGDYSWLEEHKSLFILCCSK